MVGHIVELCNDLLEAIESEDFKSAKGLYYTKYFSFINTELSMLNIMEFAPSYRTQFLFLKSDFDNFSKQAAGLTLNDIFKTNLRDKTTQLINNLSSYGQIAASRMIDLSFMVDPELKAFATRDFHDLATKLILDRAWKSAVILAGSILEAILFDVISNPIHNSRARLARRAPKERGTNTVLRLDKWKLKDLINVAVDINLLDRTTENTIHQVLRDYRNFVHPLLEKNMGLQLDETEAILAKGAIMSVCKKLLQSV
ncbi:hypothetical protein R70723_29100 [Paenibacillus sp. FSL R7-0273]|uniref:hypothetical protein n=1 Tax=Paenibacillus sp. FSL R7-0273 TaxID=1536772 RepID=UPI0004F7455A|nr:hypothetical protein [Paenibacillus sp. FSL R7-0273]AIQ49490.1 hypothetical protein R70723_29100 [Paenibacillus sp. FSL R7-0273]OMF89690.1 hypothetical protein BK144_19210 [Paenibacillus sp. FSL R7-0273]